MASRCGFTHVNYRGLRELYDTWGPKGLEILAFPSNQFGNQEPGSDEEIQLFCRDYGLSFPIMAKVSCNLFIVMMMNFIYIFILSLLITLILTALQ